MIGSNISVEESWKASISSGLSGIVPVGPKSPDYAASASAVPTSDCVPYGSESVPAEGVSQLIRSTPKMPKECVLTFEVAHPCELADVFQTLQDQAVLVVQLLEHHLYLVEQRSRVVDGCFICYVAPMLCPQQAGDDDE